MQRFCAIGTVGLTLAMCASSWAGDADKEKAKLQGSWTLTKIVIRGEDKTQEMFEGGATVTFAGDKTTFKFGGGGPEAGSFKIVDATKKPMHLDLTHKGSNAKGIYAIEGDTLKIATADKDRPTSFDAENIIVMTFKKISK